MKKISNIYNQIISKENLYTAVHNAAKSKRYNAVVSDFLFSQEKNVDILHAQLRDRTYKHGKYRIFKIKDPKQREIAAAPFADRVVHHAVCDVIEPVIDKTFIYDSYACRKDKGTHKAMYRAQKFCLKNRYSLHMDISKYFKNIDHKILKRLLLRQIDDPRLIWLLFHIIESSPKQFFNKGLPIGNLTSQLFANMYLHEVDMFIKHRLKEKYYIRYMDDMLIFCNDKQGLLNIKSIVEKFLKEQLSLDLNKGKSQLFDTRKGFNFLGFRMSQKHRRLCSDNVRRFRKRLYGFEQMLANKIITEEKVQDSIRCWVAHASYGHTKSLCNSMCNHILKKKMKVCKITDKL